MAESGVDYRVTTNRGDLFIIRLENIEIDNDGCCKNYQMDVITINGEEKSCKLGCDPIFLLQL